MKVIAVITALVAAAAAGPAAVSENSRRRITAAVTTCREPNLRNCESDFVPIDSCYAIQDCQTRSLSTGGHICDFYSEPSCGGSVYKYAGIQEDLSESILVRSVFCW